MATARVSVPGVHCEHCVASIEGSVSKAAGVRRVDVDLETRSVTVEHDSTITGRDEITRLIEDQGYDVELVEEVSA